MNPFGFLYRHRLLNWAFVVIYALAIFYFSSKPAADLPSTPVSMPWLHLAEYFGFGLMLLPLVKSSSKGNYLAFSFILLAAYAASDEIHQYVVPGREMDLYDWLVDCLGGLLGLFLSKKALILSHEVPEGRGGKGRGRKKKAY